MSSKKKVHDVDWNPSDRVPDANKIQDLQPPSPRGDSREKAQCKWSSSRAAGLAVRTAEQGQACPGTQLRNVRQGGTSGYPEQQGGHGTNTPNK